MPETKSPPVKRVKFHKSESTELHLEIGNDIQQALQYLHEIKRRIGFSSSFSSPQAQGNDETQHIVSDVKALRNGLQSVAEYLNSHQPFKSVEQRTQAESVFLSIPNPLSKCLSVDSLVLLASTSHAMSKLFSPLIFEMPISLPTDSAIKFEHLKPTTLEIKSAVEIPPTVTRLVVKEAIPLMPENITHITFGSSFNQPVDLRLPVLTHLKFGEKFDSPLTNLPNKITHLDLGKVFNQPLSHLLPSLQQISFGKSFSHELPETVRELKTRTQAPILKLPPALTHFCLKTDSENNLQCPLPHTLTHLHLRGGNPQIDFSPLWTLTELRITGIYGKENEPPLTNLPSSLDKLEIYGKWNGSLASLPQNLRILTIGSIEFNHPLDALPSLFHLSLKKVCKKFSYPLENLPTSLKTLAISCQYSHSLQISGLINLKSLEISPSCSEPALSLPTNLTSITFAKHFDSHVSQKTLPPNLTHLTFGSKFCRNVDDLPPTITHLQFGKGFNGPVDHLPISLTHLTLPAMFTHDVDHLPPHITHLSFGFGFNLPVDNLPSKITHLTFGHCFNRKVSNLPPNLTHLTFGFSFNQEIHSLPRKLTHLKLSVKFRKPIYNLPNSLYHLELPMLVGHIDKIAHIHLPPDLAIFRIVLIYNYRVFMDENIIYDQFVRDLNKNFEDAKLRAVSLTFNLLRNQLHFSGYAARRLFFEFVHHSSFLAPNQ